MWDVCASRQFSDLRLQTSSTVNSPSTGLRNRDLSGTLHVRLYTQMISIHDHDPTGVLFLAFNKKEDRGSEKIKGLAQGIN